MVYGLKYHTTSADNMSTDWLGPRMYRPTLGEVVRGALSATPRTDMHYVTQFRYPTRGGFVSYLRRFAERTEVRLCHRLVRFDARLRKLHFDNGAVISYDRVISSIPLPDLIACLVGAPTEVRAAASRLGLHQRGDCEPGCRTAGPVRSPHFIRLRPRDPVRAHQLPAHAVAALRASWSGQHSG